jgi:putative membrane protein
VFGLALFADWDHGRMMNNAGNGWWWVMGFGMLAIVIAAVVVVVWLVTRTAHPGAVAPSDPNLRARQILSERLARGEIDPAEYQERLSHIT